MQGKPRPVQPRSRANLARRAWQLMFDYLMSTRPARDRSLERRGLTPNDARALWSLDARDGRPIGSLSREWGCDPANATFIIGRLERAGLARRRGSDRDRRIKLVTLTPKGTATKRDLLREYHAPPAALRSLTQPELATLIDLMTKLCSPATRRIEARAPASTPSPRGEGARTRRLSGVRPDLGQMSEIRTRTGQRRV
jgi:DNA-binding MarR family transcriptional regulator